MHYGKQRKCVPIFGPCGVYHLTFSILQAGIQNVQDRSKKNCGESRKVYFYNCSEYVSPQGESCKSYVVITNSQPSHHSMSKI